MGQDVGQLVDPGLDLALLFLGCVVAAVLPQVPLIPRGFDLLGDVDPALAGKVIQLALEPVMRLLSEPGDSIVARLGHKYSSHPLAELYSAGPRPGPAWG